jgi:glycosyltransferase involved in cell wall biosynthesis
VIPNGIRLQASPSLGQLQALRGELAVAEAQLVVGTVGRLDRVKAHDFLLESFGKLLAEWPGPPMPVLIIVGDGPERLRLQHQVERAGLAASVRMLGWRTDVNQLLGVFDLFVLPSDSEGTSISLLEAMGAGCAVVATEVGGTPDVLGRSLREQLVAARDVDEFVARMKATLFDLQHRHAIAAIGRARIEAQYSLQAMARAYEALYDEILAAE